MLSCAVVLLLLVSRVEPRLLVHTAVGSIQGLPADDGDYAMFLGIPYARVNASNPFGESIPHDKFDELFEAFNESAMCPQITEAYATVPSSYSGSLDCLRLNVYVPNTPTTDRAVLFYVHGGKHRGNSRQSFYGPKYLVRHDIIVVTFNFRLGPYGFMCLDIPEIPGNQGLKDQYEAMKWVRDNIRAFGGDPQKITIGGHSYGATYVDFHLLTRQPRLFQQAIIQSASATTPNVFTVQSDTMSLINIANKLGLKTNHTDDAMAYLATVNPETIIKATDNEYRWPVCAEKQFDGGFSYILEHPELSEGTNIDGMKILGGFTDRESIVSTLYKKQNSSKNIDVFQFEVEKKFNLGNSSSIPDIIRHFYVGDDKNHEAYANKLVEFLSMYYFVYPVYRELDKYAKHRNTNVYMYLFSYNGEMNRFKREHNITESGATHGDELGYLFTTDSIPDTPNRADRRMIDQMTTLWTNFVKYGNPTPARSALLPLPWPSLAGGAAPCLQIDADLAVISRPFQKDVAFWELFFDAHWDKLILTTP